MSRIVALAFALAVSLAVAAPSSASTIVTFGEVGTNEFVATDNGDGTTSLNVSAVVSITQIISGSLDPAAVFTLSAISNNDATLLLGQAVTQRYEGSFTLTNAANTVTYLEGTFGAALEFGGNGSTGATLTANSFPQSPPLVLSSDLLALMNPESFGLTFANISPTLHIDSSGPNPTIASFTASFSGVADAQEQVQAVPEPTSLLLLGTGLVAGARELRKRLARG